MDTSPPRPRPKFTETPRLALLRSIDDELVIIKELIERGTTPRKRQRAIQRRQQLLRRKAIECTGPLEA